MVKSILVTGSAGHLGEALMRRMRAEGRPALGLDRRASPYTGFVGSIEDRRFVDGCLAGVGAVIHAAGLHKPHLATHGEQAFLKVNVRGTLTLLQAAKAAGVASFVFTSTTSAFGAALAPGQGRPAAWITEDVAPIPRNIYGVSKLSAESLCELYARQHGLPAIVLRTARFFPEADDNPIVRQTYGLANCQANELLYRRADIADIVEAHLLAVERAAGIGFGRYILSATTPFGPADAAEAGVDAPALVRRLHPECDELYAARGWKLFPSIDRIYANRRAIAALGWRPKYDFAQMLRCLAAGEDWRSPLSLQVGSKGYHAAPFAEGPYPAPSA